MSEEIINEIIEKAQLERWKIRKPMRGWVPWIIPTSWFIREYLLLKGEAYPWEIYKALSIARKKIMGNKYFIGSPLNFYKYIWILEKLGLIKRTGRIEESLRGVKGSAGKLPRRMWRIYYRITPGMENSELWLNPQKELYKYKNNKKK